MSYLNLSKRNLSNRNGMSRRFRRSRRAGLSMCKRKLMISRPLALVGPAYTDSHLPVTSWVMVAAAFFHWNHRDYKTTRLIRLFFFTFAAFCMDLWPCLPE
jgi:hypothetical protein